MKTPFLNPREILYFNSANLSLCPNPVIEAIEKYRRQFEENPTQGLKEAWGGTGSFHPTSIILKLK